MARPVEHLRCAPGNNGVPAAQVSPGPAIPVSSCPALQFCPDFIDAAHSLELYVALRDSQSWPANHYHVCGRRFDLPRLQTWHADPGIVYSYSNNLLVTRPWTPLLLRLRNQVEQAVGQAFNAVLMNYYRDGNDYVGWHADDEAELGSHPLIASLTLGTARPFAFRRREQIPAGTCDLNTNSDTLSLNGNTLNLNSDTLNLNGNTLSLNSGSLLIMQPAFQDHWQHSLPPQPHLRGGRINLTFRYVLAPDAP